MNKNSNNLSPAELERLAILAEEMGEALQEIGKILRHGYDACNPITGIANRRSLENELGDVRHAMIMLCNANDVSKDAIHKQAEYKRADISKWLHHQE